MRLPNPFNRKSSLDRLLGTLDDSLGAAGDLTSRLPRRIGTDKAKAGLIAAGGLAESHRRQRRGLVAPAAPRRPGRQLVTPGGDGRFHGRLGSFVCATRP